MQTHGKNTLKSSLKAGKQLENMMMNPMGKKMKMKIMKMMRMTQHTQKTSLETPHMQKALETALEAPHTPRHQNTLYIHNAKIQNLRYNN